MKLATLGVIATGSLGSLAQPGDAPYQLSILKWPGTFAGIPGIPEIPNLLRGLPTLADIGIPTLPSLGLPSLPNLGLPGIGIPTLPQIGVPGKIDVVNNLKRMVEDVINNVVERKISITTAVIELIASLPLIDIGEIINILGTGSFQANGEVAPDHVSAGLELQKELFNVLRIANNNVLSIGWPTVAPQATTTVD